MIDRKNSIPLKDISHDPSSYVDPQGYVFHYQGAIYRCVYPKSVPLFKQIMENGTLGKLENKFNLVSTQLSDLNIAEHPDAMIVNHEKIWPLSYPVEWGPSMLYYAARLTLELAIELTDHNLMLQDAYPWNVLFKGTKPVFIDFTSISTIDDKVLWPAHEQFEAFFLRPLILSKQGKGFFARAMMYDYINGVSLPNFVLLLDASYYISHPGLSIALWLDEILQSSIKAKERIRAFSERTMQNTTPAIRKRFLQKLLKKIGTPPAVNQSDPWRDYYAGINETFDKKYKIKTVSDMVQRLSPDTVLDIGCNTGVFSIEAAKKGARVVSLDSSEPCIEQLYKTACKQGLAITPLIADITSPTPAFGYMCEQYSNMLERIRSDCVLFLGIMHHIHLSGRQSLERIAQMLDKVANKYLVFEFVSMHDANIPHLPQRRTIDYNEDSVKQALAKYFITIEVHPSDRNTRKLFLCTK